MRLPTFLAKKEEPQGRLCLLGGGAAQPDVAELLRSGRVVVSSLQPGENVKPVRLSGEHHAELSRCPLIISELLVEYCPF